jgi:hypothetical protein
MRTKKNEAGPSEDLVTLWHVGGKKPCRGPALKMPPGFLEAEKPVVEGCERPDGSKLRPGDPLVCGTCGERLEADFSSDLALSRERYRS